MNQPTPNVRPPHDRPEPPPTLEDLAARVAASAPSITALGVHLADVERAYEKYDSAPTGSAIRSALHVLDERREALRDLILTLPAQTIQDAAVQIEAAWTVASSLTASEFDQVTAERMADQIERALVGMLPVVASAAGLDLDAMYWRDTVNFRTHRFVGVGVAS